MSEQVLTPLNKTTSERFYGLIGKLPASIAEWTTRQDTLRQWRADPTFQAYWNSIDHMLTDTFEGLRQRAAAFKAAESIGTLDGYDFDAAREQREYDRLHAGDHWK